MKTLTLQQLLAILAQISKGHTNFKKKLAAYSRPLRRLYSLESDPNNTITASSEVYKFVFESDDYKDHQLTTLRTQLRQALTDFIKLRMLEESAIGQNFIADLYEKYGHHEWANKASKKALQLTAREPEQQRWLSSFQAHMALHLGGAKGHLKKAQQGLLLFFFVSFLKLSIEDLTIFRIKGNKGIVPVATSKEIKQILGLLPEQTPPIITIQAKAIEYYLSPNLATYEIFKTFFCKKVISIDSDKKFFLNSVINAVALYPNPSAEILRQYIPLYKFGIENNLFNEDGNLELKTVCNILGVADFLGAYVLMELAKEKLILFLADKKERVWCELLAEIYALFGGGKFAQALVKIKELDNENSRRFDITLRKNIVKLKCSYEISETSADAYSKISEAKHNFDKLLNRNVENKNTNVMTKTHSSNFIKFLMMICNPNTAKYTKDYLLKKLTSYKGEIMETRWLKEKIAERPF